MPPVLTGTDLITNLADAITPAQVNIPLLSSGDLSSKLTTGQWAYFLLDDGTKQEIVKGTAISADGKLSVVRGQFGTIAQSFVKGVCVKPYTGINFLCEMFAQGGCQGATTPTACTPVTVATESMPDAIIGKTWTGVIAFSNATSVLAVKKPSWVTATVTGSTMILTGIPPASAANAPVVVRADGCNSSISLVNTSVKVCNQVAV
jgi:hypothetical protein